MSAVPEHGTYVILRGGRLIRWSRMTNTHSNAVLPWGALGLLYVDWDVRENAPIYAVKTVPHLTSVAMTTHDLDAAIMYATIMEENQDETLPPA